ncbi:MAG TPA: hypothetical protein VM432_14225, partial [Bdellovibrionales bacterium]|nr:hypothetical protein [Bdellovibrionales bacterium]
DLSAPSGVATKIAGQIRSWSRLGNDAQAFVISTNQPDLSCFELPSASVTTFSASLGSIRGGARTYLNKIASARNAFTAIERFQPDLIYYRLGIWYPGLERILKLAPTVVEINSFELNELGSENFVKRNLYPWGRNKILQTAAGFVCVSHEIATDLAILQKPVLVSGNGTDFRSRPSRAVRSERPQAIFVGSPNQFWHGSDKIVRLAELLPEVDFHIVGTTEPKSLHNLFQHGPLFGDGLERLYSEMDFGISSLACHRKNMHEASSLKSREYASHGLPFVYAYRDTDLPETLSSTLRIDNTEDNVERSANAIRDFAFTWKARERNAEIYRPYLDRDLKEERRLEFFRRVTESMKGMR